MKFKIMIPVYMFIDNNALDDNPNESYSSFFFYTVVYLLE